MKKIIFIGMLAVCLFSFFSVHANEAQLKKAIELTYHAQFDQAESLLNAHIAANPADPLGYLRRGTNRDWKQLINGLDGKLDQSILEDFQTANKYAFLQWDKDQNNVDKMVNLGNAYMFLSKKWLDMGKKARAGLILKKCQKHMEKAIKLNPQKWEAYLAIGIFNFYAGNLPPGFKFLASILGISGDEKKGVEQLEKVANNPNLFRLDSNFVLAYAFGYTKKNYTGALKYLDLLTQQFPDNPYFLFLKGEYAHRSNNFDLASKNLNTFLNFCAARKGGCSQVYLFLSNYFMAGTYIKQKNYTAAKSYVEKAESLNQNKFKDRTPTLNLYKGLVLKAEGKKQEAVRIFTAVANSPDASQNTKTRALNELKGL